ncbi:MAG: DNA mismatch repair protein MutS [Myxococcales bacterium FL481]|nr:MAG: DNA mismatch repair protein MutS [Myxococcales bacterium FL481]
MRDCRVPDPRDRYSELAALRRDEATRLDRQDRSYSHARVATFLCGAGALVVALVTQQPIWLAPVGLAAAVFLTLIVRHERLARRLVESSRRTGYYARALRRLDEQWQDDGCVDRSFVPPDHPYAADLDLFGPGSLFQRISEARTQRGQRRLAAWFCEPAPFPEVAARQRSLVELRSRCELREALAVAGPDLAVVDVEATAAWGRAPTPGRLTAWWLGPAAWVLPAGFVVSLVAAWQQWLPLWPAAVVLALEALVMHRLRHVISQTRVELERQQPAVAALGRMLSCVETQAFDEPSLRNHSEHLRVDEALPSTQVSRLNRRVSFFEAYFGGWFAVIAFPLLWPVHCLRALEAWRRESGPAVDRWLDGLAEFEARLSLAAYAFENPEDTFPVLDEAGPRFVATALGHPLLPRATCVANDIALDPTHQALLVSGSNMSGKSTFLRSVGINAVLAQAGAPVRATHLALSPLRIGATVRVEDSLQAGRSRFYAEIVRLKAIVDLATDAPTGHALFLLDEVFHGTNSRDRRISASALIRRLLAANAVGLVTTHDLELTKIADELAPRLRNVHFCDELRDDVLHFDYRVRPGVVQRSNAQALMQAVGLALDDQVTA